MTQAEFLSSNTQDFIEVLQILLRLFQIPDS